MTIKTKSAMISTVTAIVIGYLAGSFANITNWSTAEMIGFNLGSMILPAILGSLMYYYLTKEKK